MPVAAIGLAISAYSAYSQGQQSRDARDRRNDAIARQEGVYAEDQAYYRKKYGPVNDMLIDYVMGNKPSAALAQGLSSLESSYGVARRKVEEIQAREGLWQSGIGEGQKIGLGLSEAKARAGLQLSEQADRYRVAQALGQSEAREQLGAQGRGGAYGTQAGYANQDYQNEERNTQALWGAAANSLGAGIEYMTADPATTKISTEQIDKISDTKYEYGAPVGGWPPPRSH